VRAAELTDGAVDPTLGDRLQALGYDRDFEALTAVNRGTPLPAPSRSLAEPRISRWRAIELSRTPPAALLPLGAQLDLGATAKALAADRGAQAASRAIGGAGVVLSLGGDLAVSGAAPDGGWPVRVTDDHGDRSGTGQLVTIDSGGLATSSLTTRRWRHENRAMHHVLDPATGEPVAAVWRTASVAAATCAEANIASTAALVLGARAPGWLAARALPSRLVAIDGTVRTQCGWPA
jgi:thiamine biosynthesis lipoprotein